jgi:FkbM family methyltransferase
MIKRRVADLLRAMLARRGYLLLNCAVMRFGVSPFIDMGRLNVSWKRRMDVIFDVGANVGQFASEAMREVPGARIYSFEPHPQTFQRLQKAMAAKEISLHQLALGERSGNVTLYEYDASGDLTQINSLVPDSRFAVVKGLSAAKIGVPCSTIDSFCLHENVDHIGLLKIDTEGFDLFVLRGAQRMLSEHRVDFVYVEFNDLYPKQDATGGALLPIADYLSQFGLIYVTSYTDTVVDLGEVFISANALFALPPGRVPRLASAPHAKSPRHDNECRS